MRLLKRFYSVYKWLLIAMFACMIFATIAQVVFRYFLNFPLGWTEELARVLFIWCTFLSIAILAEQGKLVRVDILVNSLPPAVQQPLQRIVRLASGLVLLWLAYHAYRLLDLARGQTSPALDIPYLIIYASLPLGVFISALVMLAVELMHAYSTWRRR